MLVGLAVEQVYGQGSRARSVYDRRVRPAERRARYVLVGRFREPHVVAPTKRISAFKASSLHPVAER